MDYESHATALDRNEMGAMLVVAGLGPPVEHALISLLALNGLRVSEATGTDIEHDDPGCQCGPARRAGIGGGPLADPATINRQPGAAPQTWNRSRARAPGR